MKRKVMYVKSMTSGNPLPAWYVRQSKLRKFLRLPHIRLSVVVRGFSGEWASIGWYRPEEIDGGEGE